MTETARDHRNAEKLMTMRTLLNTRESVFIHLDPATFGVQTVLPSHLRNQAQVVLQVGYNMPVPIPDLLIDGDGVSGTLQFKGNRFTCVIPWQAVFALVGDDKQGRVWNEDMPPPVVAEVKAEIAKKQKVEGDLESRPTSQYLKPVKRERPEWMRVIKGDKQD